MTDYAIVDPQGNQVGSLTLDYGLSIKEAAPVAAPEPKMVERRVMTDAANGYSYEQHISIGWTDQALLDHGLMRIEMVPEDEAGPAAPPTPAVAPPPAPAAEAPMHESLQQTQLGPEWQPVEPEAPQPPAAPSAPEAPAAPSAPEVPVPAAPQAEQTEQPADEDDGYQHAQVPRIEGREFIIRNVSYETVVDKDGVPFDGRIHGVTADNKPALKKDKTFKKKRNLDNDTYEQILAQLKAAMAGGETQAQPQQQAVPTPPPVPQATAEPTPVPNAPSNTVPPVPGAASTAPKPPADLAELEAAISEWGEEI